MVNSLSHPLPKVKRKNALITRYLKPAKDQEKNRAELQNMADDDVKQAGYTVKASLSYISHLKGKFKK